MKVWQVLVHPEIRPIGRGRGTRLTEHDYLALIGPFPMLKPSHLASARGTSSVVRPDPREGRRGFDQERDKGRAEIRAGEVIAELLAGRAATDPDKVTFRHAAKPIPQRNPDGKRSGRINKLTSVLGAKLVSAMTTGIWSPAPINYTRITRLHHETASSLLPPRPSCIMRPRAKWCAWLRIRRFESRPQTGALREPAQAR